MGKENKRQKIIKAIVHGTIEGDYDREKFNVEIEKGGKITLWEPTSTTKKRK